MLYVIILALLGALAGQHVLHDAERRRWDAERKNLLDRIQAPHVAAAAAAEALGGGSGEQPTEAERIRQKAEAMGISVDGLRTPPGWGSLGW
jgi:hypothetical protein